MSVVHPLWRGFYLALCLAAARVLLGPVDVLSIFRLDRRMVALAGAVAVGAFLASLPRRLRRRNVERSRTSWQRCLIALLCGAAMALAYRISGGGWVLPALMEGSAGAYAFAGMSLLTGFLTVRIAGRRRTA